MSLLLLLNPKQYGGAAVEIDKADVWRKRRKKLQELEEAEEALAIQKLMAQLKPVDNYIESDRVKLHKILGKSVSDKYHDTERKERDRKLLLFMLLTDTDD